MMKCDISHPDFLKEQSPADAMDIAAGNFDTIENYFRELEKFNNLGHRGRMRAGDNFQAYYAERLKWARLHPTKYKREMGIVPGEDFTDPTLHLKKLPVNKLLRLVDEPDNDIPNWVIDWIKDEPQNMDTILDLYLVTLK